MHIESYPLPYEHPEKCTDEHNKQDSEQGFNLFEVFTGWGFDCENMAGEVNHWGLDDLSGCKQKVIKICAVKSEQVPEYYCRQKKHQ